MVLADRWYGSKYLRIACWVLLPLAVYLIPQEWIFSEGHTLCLFKNITGHECYGCGITRAMVCLMHFDFAGAYHYHRAVFIIAPVLFYLWSGVLWRAFKAGKSRI